MGLTLFLRAVSLKCVVDWYRQFAGLVSLVRRAWAAPHRSTQMGFGYCEGLNLQLEWCRMLRGLTTIGLPTYDHGQLSHEQMILGCLAPEVDDIASNYELVHTELILAGISHDS